MLGPQIRDDYLLRPLIGQHIRLLFGGRPLDLFRVLETGEMRMMTDFMRESGELAKPQVEFPHLPVGNCRIINVSGKDNAAGRATDGSADRRTEHTRYNLNAGSPGKWILARRRELDRIFIYRTTGRLVSQAKVDDRNASHYFAWKRLQHGKDIGRRGRIVNVIPVIKDHNVRQPLIWAPVSFLWVLFDGWLTRGNGHDWQKPDVNILKGILSSCVFGVELDQNAIDLTAFSLSLAICDALQPDVIWRDLKFTRLRGSNLLQDDFFSVLAESEEDGSSFPANGFDVVIGNPPFESELSESGAFTDKSAQKQNRSRGSLPDNQAAYLFLEQALSVAKPKGRVCLIQPHGLLYNRKAQGFRAGIFRNRRVDTIFDFTSIRSMYDGADVKTIAILAHADKPDSNHQVKHWTFRRTVTTHERISFELDHYDRHYVSQQQALDESFVWRTNLLGGGRLFDIAARLRSVRTLAEYVRQMGWDYGEGFTVGNRKHDAPFLTGKALLPTTAFTADGIDESKIATVTDTKFECPRKEALYTSPLVLIKESESLPTAYWSQSDLAYGHEIVGIHAPPSQEKELYELYNGLCSNHRMYRLSCALNGARSLVGKATAILKKDVDLLPYPEDMSEIALAFWEEALCNDVLDYMASYVRLGQNSEVLTNAADADSLGAFSSLFRKMLGSIYDNLQAADPIFLNGLTCQPFYFGKCPNLSWLTDQTEDGLKALIYDDKSHESLRTIRMLRFYFENVILLIKPDRLRYWIQSTAIRDADETLIDLRRQRY